MASFTVPRLYYFDIPGKGEAIRLACTYGKFAFIDHRFKSRDEFFALRDNGTLKYGQVPALQVGDGQVIAQSNAIMRYIGKKTGLYPADDLQAALVDSVLDAEIDMFVGLGCTIYKERFGFDFLNHKPELVVETRTFLNTDTLPRHLQNLEKLMQNSTTGWICNTDGPSIADFVLVPRLTWLVGAGHEGISTDLIENNSPLLAGMMARFMALGPIQTYYSAVTVSSRKAEHDARV